MKNFLFNRTDEPPLFDGLFIAQDAKVSAFVEQIRSQMCSVRIYSTLLTLAFKNLSWYYMYHIVFTFRGQVMMSVGQQHLQQAEKHHRNPGPRWMKRALK